MLMLKSPSLVINSHDVPGPTYRMWETTEADPGTDAYGVVREIIRVNRLALEHERSQLLNVVINCHGADGGGALYVGGTDGSERTSAIRIDTVNNFHWLKQRNIGTLWLVACQAARGNLGQQLCQQLAVVSGCQVVASDENQDVGIWDGWQIIQGGGRGQIDEFEGAVYSFTPNGTMRKINPHADIYTILE